jgi:DNA-binding IclR family transcriptional regulator
MAAAGRHDEDEVLRLIDADPAATLAKIARAMNWKMHDGDPNKMRAKRCVDALKRAKLVRETRTGRWQLTPEGKKVRNGE